MRTTVFFQNPTGIFFTRVKNTDFIRIFSLNIALIPGCWEKHHHGRSRVSTVYTGGRLGLSRVQVRRVDKGWYFLGFHSQNPQRTQGNTQILRRSTHCFFRSNIWIRMFWGSNDRVFRGYSAWRALHRWSSHPEPSEESGDHTRLLRRSSIRIPRFLRD